MNDYTRAVDEWERDVDAEATKLIRRGIAPWSARVIANERVSERRQRLVEIPDAHP